MQRVFVLSETKKPLMPCHTARARELLRNGRAKVYRAQPFTIILIHRQEGVIQPTELNIDPGSKTTGIAIVIDAKKGRRVVTGFNLQHRGDDVRKNLEQRCAIRRSRRHRKTRYRKPRFLNRKRTDGWLPPSLVSRVDNVVNFSKKLKNICPIKAIAVETVRFDMQKLVNPEISGTDYQKGTLHGFEVKEYLLEKWNRQCAYCDAKQVPLQIEHIIPKSKGGTNRVSNLTLACRSCNQSKNNQSVAKFLETKPAKLKKIMAQAQKSLKDAAAVNATRFKIGKELASLDLPISFWTGGRTKYNRVKQNYSKDHWIDAACIGNRGENVFIEKSIQPLNIKACGRGSRQMCRVNSYGFPRTTSKKNKIVLGFKSGDLVKVIVTKGKKMGKYRGKIAVRSTGYFNVKTQTDIVQGIHAKYCKIIQKSDGYNYIGGSTSSYH